MKMTQFILMVVWEYPQAQESGEGTLPARVPATFPNLAWPRGKTGGDLGGDTVVLVFGCGFVFKRSYIQLGGFPSRPVFPGI